MNLLLDREHPVPAIRHDRAGRPPVTLDSGDDDGTLEPLIGRLVFELLDHGNRVVAQVLDNHAGRPSVSLEAVGHREADGVVAQVPIPEARDDHAHASRRRHPLHRRTCSPHA
jgi:hypothetical protein